jgi:hypothetical protein
MIEVWTHHECAQVALEVQIDSRTTFVSLVQGGRGAYERLTEYVTQVC